MGNLTFSISEYVKQRVREGETDVRQINIEILRAVDSYLEDASIGDTIDTSRYNINTKEKQ